MSSKLLRGGAVATEPVVWRRVSSSGAIGEAIREAISGAGPPCCVSEPGPGPGAKSAGDIQQRLDLARWEGVEEGKTASRRSLAAQVEAMQMKLARSIEELTGARLRARREAEQDVVALALAVARRILHRELTVAPEALWGLVKAALEKLEAREVHRVRVAPSDAAALGKFIQQMGLPQRVELIEDATLAPGSVLIDSSRGVLDASVDTQLAEIERGFADLVRSGS
jgi:flagellar assembly protein FliH